jgi:hypothetical protein
MVVGMHVAHASPALVAWGNAWLSGHVGLDEAVDAIEQVNGQHVVAGIPGETGEVPLRRGLGSLRVAGMTAFKLALPVPGDLLGLTGPPELNTAALDAGQAAIVTLTDRSIGLVPAEDRRGSSYLGVRWNVLGARQGVPDVPSLPEADHQLTLAVRDATDSLLMVEDVSDWRPEMAEALTAVRESHRGEPAAGLAPGYPARAHRVAALAGRLAVVVDLARRVESEGLSADQMRRRSEALRLLDHAVRRATVAAHNSAFDPVP